MKLSLKEEMNSMKKAAIVYQFCILGAIIGLTVYFAVTSKSLNETLVGALIGVMAGIGIKDNGEVEIIKVVDNEVKEDEQ